LNISGHHSGGEDYSYGGTSCICQVEGLKYLKKFIQNLIISMTTGSSSGRENAAIRHFRGEQTKEQVSAAIMR
jgi:hypothetical protein